MVNNVNMFKDKKHKIFICFSRFNPRPPASCFQNSGALNQLQPLT